MKNKTLIKKSDFFNTNDSLFITDEGVQDLRILCDIVIKKHYNFVKYSEREDLICEGYLTCLELLNSDKIDPTLNLFNYLYSGIRNNIHNYMLRFSREIQTDFDFIENTNEVSELIDDETYHRITEIKKEILENTFSKFQNKAYLLNGVLKKLEENSFHVIGYSYKEDGAEYTEDEQRDIDSIMAYILWKHFRG